MPPRHSPIRADTGDSPPVAWVVRRNMDPWLPTLLIWTLLMAGPIPVIHSLSHRSNGSRHDL